MLTKLLFFLIAWFSVAVIVALSAVRLLVEPVAPGAGGNKEAEEHAIEERHDRVRIPADSGSNVPLVS